jgi:hypothetical protein
MLYSSDPMELNGKDLRPLPLAERKATLAKLLASDMPLGSMSSLPNAQNGARHTPTLWTREARHRFLKAVRPTSGTIVFQPWESTDSVRNAMIVQTIISLSLFVAAVFLAKALIYAFRSEPTITPPTLDWAFANANVLNALPDNERLRLRLQVASDIYRALQTRLDGYRQSAAAIFLGVIAGLLTLDASLTSNFGRIIVGVDVVDKSRSPQVNLRITYIMFGCAIMLALAGVFIYWILRTIRHYFAEMTGVVYKFDLANKAFVPDVWFSAQTLYPYSFRTNRTLIIGGEILSVWYDPSIKVFIEAIVSLFFFHVVAFFAVSYYMLNQQ